MSKTARLLVAALAVLLVTLTAAQSRAETTVVVRPDDVRVVQGDWTFVPVVAITDGTSVDTIGALALYDMSKVVGNNIVAVWYTNPHNPNTAWPAVTWQSQSQWNAIKWVKTEYGVSDTWDFIWLASDTSDAEPTAEVPVGYDKGLVEGDPLADIGDPATHDEIVKVLVDAGYQAASLPVDKDGPCDTKTVLPALGDITTLNVLFNPTPSELSAAFATMVSATCAVVAAPIWNPGVPGGTWTPRPLWPTAPASDPHSMPGWPTVPVCTPNPPPATGCTCKYLRTLICTALCAPPPGAILEEVSCLCPAAACPMTCVNPGSTDPAAAGCFTCAPTGWYWY
jgi:hypothetical protein